jgi:putative hemolysin
MDDYLFSYAAPTDPPVKRKLIRLMEKATGQPALKRLYLDNQRHPRPSESFWAAAVRSLALNVLYDEAALARLPRTGPAVFVANHPYGVLDGLVISWLIEKVRPDFVVLTNAVLMRAAEIRDFILPIDFSDAPTAREINIKSRAAARAQLEKGGAVVVFPAGAVSTAPDRLGRRPAVDSRWQPFAAQLIQRSRATVAPIWFGGQNSRIFQIASHLSQTLRLALIFHEVKTRIGATLPVAIGRPIPFEEIAHLKDRQALADALRARTYALALHPPRPAAAHRAGLPGAIQRETKKMLGRFPIRWNHPTRKRPKRKLKS